MFIQTEATPNPATIDRRIGARSLEQTGQCGGFVQGHVTRRFAEITVGGGVDAKGTGAEINPVEVEFEDLLLGQLGLQPDRQDDLLDLARDGSFRLEEQILGKLLGDGRTALDDAAGPKIGDHRPGQADRSP